MSYDNYETRMIIRELRAKLLERLNDGTLPKIGKREINAAIKERREIDSKRGPYRAAHWEQADVPRVKQALVDELEGITPATRHLHIQPDWQERGTHPRGGYRPGVSQILAVVINPKLKIPVIVGYSSNEVGIYVPAQYIEDAEWGRLPEAKVSRSGSQWKNTGSGHLDDSDRAAYATGYPRTHTPNGVWPEGEGFGTVLYTSLVCMAKFVEDMDAVSTAPDHSAAAGRWWQAAVRKDLAYEYEGEQELDHEDVTSHVSSIDFHDRGIDVDEIHEVVISGTEQGGEFIVYEFEKAVAHNLVLFGLTTPHENATWKDARGALKDVDWTKTDDMNVEAIAACNVEGYPREFVLQLARLASEEDEDNEDIRDMLIRNAYDTDPESLGGKQREFEFDRENPGRRVGDLYMRPNPDAVDPSLHNVSDYELEKSLDRAEELREELGWYDLEDLP